MMEAIHWCGHKHFKSDEISINHTNEILHSYMTVLFTIYSSIHLRTYCTTTIIESNSLTKEFIQRQIDVLSSARFIKKSVSFVTVFLQIKGCIGGKCDDDTALSNLQITVSSWQNLKIINLNERSKKNTKIKYANIKLQWIILFEEKSAVNNSKRDIYHTYNNLNVEKWSYEV